MILHCVFNCTQICVQMFKLLHDVQSNNFIPTLPYYVNFLIKRQLVAIYRDKREISIIHQDFLIETLFMHEPPEINTISDMLILLCSLMELTGPLVARRFKIIAFAGLLSQRINKVSSFAVLMRKVCYGAFCLVNDVSISWLICYIIRQLSDIILFVS